MHHRPACCLCSLVRVAHTCSVPGSVSPRFRKRKSRYRCLKLALICAVAALHLAGPAAAEDPPANAVRIVVDGDGRLRTLHVGPRAFAGHGEAAGLFVQEGDSAALAVAGLAIGQGRVTDLAPAGLRVTASLESQADGLLLSGLVEDQRGQAERSVDVVFRLPFAPAVWWGSISETIGPDAAPAAVARRRERKDLPEGAGVLERIEHGGLAQDFMPLQCVTTPDEQAGMALAIPPDTPCRFRFAHLREPGCLELRFLFGLSPAAAPEWRSRATFRALIYPVDGHWGFRDALRRYHALHAPVFQRRTEASGLWLVSMPSLKDVTDSENYAFWQATRLQETPLAMQMGLAAFPYCIVGQRELGYLRQKVSGYDDVLSALASKPESTRKARYSWEVVKPLVESSALHGPDGRIVYRLRETAWAGNSISFPMNPSPFLPVGEGHPTAASHTFAEIEEELRNYPSLAGVFVDSLAMWGSYENYRCEHFAAARSPLAHDAQGRVCLPNWMPHVDFLRELHRRIGPRLVFGNGVRPGRAFCAFELDILGMECSPLDLVSRTQIDCLRSLAGPKPAVCLLNYPEEGLSRAEAEQYVQRLVALGLAPEMRRVPWPRYKDRDADLYRRFMPIYRRLDRAGWQPVTGAAARGSDVWLERFGTAAPELYFSVYNSQSAPAEVRITVDCKALSLPAGGPWRELVEDRNLQSLEQPLRLAPHALRVIQVGR